MSVSSTCRRIAAAAVAPLAVAGLLAFGAPAAQAAPAGVHASAQVCKDIFGNPNSCAQAVNWAKNHISQSAQSGFGGLCDHVVGLAYGFAHSGSTTAYNHWNAIPAVHKHAGDNSVPAGGLAYFSGGSSGAGHVMISTGGGQFISNDIHGYGTYTYTTIAEVHNTWGETYLGWAQPWFQANH